MATGFDDFPAEVIANLYWNSSLKQVVATAPGLTVVFAGKEAALGHLRSAFISYCNLSGLKLFVLEVIAIPSNHVLYRLCNVGVGAAIYMVKPLLSSRVYAKQPLQ